MHTRTVFGIILGFCLVCGGSSRLRAATYYNMQQYDGNGVAGAVGNGFLQFSNNSSTIRANFVKGMGSFTDNLVIFIDTTPGGFTSTASLSDKNTILETSISGLGLSRSVANFAPGFEADYAIALGLGTGSAVYKLVNDSTGPHLELVRSGLNLQYTDNPNAPSYSFQFTWGDIGLPNANTNFFKFESSYINSSGARSLQSFEDLTGQDAFRTVTFTNYDTYGVPPVPENTNAALAVFGGLVVIFTVGKRACHYRQPKASDR